MERKISHPGYFFLGPLLATVGSILLLSSIFHEPESITFFGQKGVSDLPWECFNTTKPASPIVFMLIDAWRYDFLASPDSPMKFVRSQVAAGQGVLMRSLVQVPTVTQPRIKALTGGVNPSFASLLGNFFSSSMTSETWLTQARLTGKRIAFYGDDTWLKLFPGYFVDSLGVPSFNVLDFTDVDNEVTRQMRKQLQNKDWDIMILHYLGLDHIGHSQGGESPEIPKKLKEMDDIIQEIFLSGRNLTVVVLGDHGMTVQGSHGGSHSSETQTPVIVLSSAATTVDSHPPSEVSTIQQVDVVSLMSFLLKQPLPSASVGTSVLPILQKSWSLPNSQVIFDFLLHLSHWGPIDEAAAYLAEMLQRPNRSCPDLERDFDHAVLGDFHRQTKTIQKDIVSQRQAIGGLVYSIGICLLLVGAVVSFWSRHASFAAWDNIFLLLPLLCTASSSFVEEEHEIWYYCVCGAVSFCLWKDTRSSSTVVHCLLILTLHRFASSASAGIRRRWTMHPDLLPGMLWEDSTLFRPVRSFGEWLQSVVFPIADGSLVGGIYSFLLAVLSLYNSSGFAAWVAFLLQASAAIGYLLGWQSWATTMVYVSSWSWMFLLLCWSPGPALILFISFIIRPTFIPVLLSTYIIGAISRISNLSPAATASLLCSSLFYTGLSNSISSIDIRAGYGGVLEYQPVIVGVQILANIYAPFLFFLIGIGKSNFIQHVMQYLTIFRILMAVSSSSFLILFSEHLFIWTVFTPKIMDTTPADINPTTPGKRKRSAQVEKGKKNRKTLLPTEFLSDEAGTRVLSCGEGDQLGHPGRTTTKKPRKIDIVEEEGMRIIQVVAGGVHSAILASDGNVYACGINEKGTVPAEGVESEGSTDEFKKIHFSEEILHQGKIIMLAAGASFTAALTKHGSVIAWGNLRDGSGKMDIHSQLVAMQKQPIIILRNKPGFSIVKIAAGENHLVMLSADGRVFTFGDFSMGQLGRSSRLDRIRTQYIAADSETSLLVTIMYKRRRVKCKNVFAGGFWSAFLSEDDNLYVCGLNNFGHLGIPIDDSTPRNANGDAPTNPKEDETELRILTPHLSPVLSGRNWTHIEGVQHLVLRDSTGIYCIGKNTDNALGLGTWSNSDSDNNWRYQTLQKLNIEDSLGVSAQLGCSIAWTDRGNAYAWGYDSSGQLGLGLKDDDEKMVPVPQEINSAHLEGYKIVQVSVADNHALFLAVKH